MDQHQDDFRIEIYNDKFVRQAFVGAFMDVQGKLRDNAISDLTLTVSNQHIRGDLLGAPGTRIKAYFRDEYLISGPLRQRAGGQTSSLVFDCQSDWRVMHNFLGYVNPTERVASGQRLTRQGEEGREYTIGRRPAETVLKDVVQKNVVERAAQRLTVAPDLKRGKVMEASFRMHPLYDRLFPAVQDAGLVVTVQQGEGGLVLDCYEPKPYPNVLTEGSRAIRNWEFNGGAPEATRGVLGGQGVGELREFLYFQDAAREAEWGDAIEVFMDARDTSDTTTHTQRIASALADTAAKSSLTIDLAETENFHILGEGGLKPGQLVTAQVGRHLPITDRVTEIDFSWNAADGLKLSATIGPKDDPDELVLQAINSLFRSILDLKAGM